MAQYGDMNTDDFMKMKLKDHVKQTSAILTMLRKCYGENTIYPSREIHQPAQIHCIAENCIHLGKGGICKNLSPAFEVREDENHKVTAVCKSYNL